MVSYGIRQTGRLLGILGPAQGWRSVDLSCLEAGCFLVGRDFAQEVAHQVIGSFL